MLAHELAHVVHLDQGHGLFKVGRKLLGRRVEFVVYESATNVLDDAIDVNTELVRGIMEGLPPGQPRGQPITVTFQLGDEGILKIIAEGPAGQELRLEYTLPGEVPAAELEKPLPSLAKW